MADAQNEISLSKTSFERVENANILGLVAHTNSERGLGCDGGEHESCSMAFQR